MGVAITKISKHGYSKPAFRLNDISGIELNRQPSAKVRDARVAFAKANPKLKHGAMKIRVRGADGQFRSVDQSAKFKAEFGEKRYGKVYDESNLPLGQDNVALNIAEIGEGRK